MASAEDRIQSFVQDIVESPAYKGLIADVSAVVTREAEESFEALETELGRFRDILYSELKPHVQFVGAEIVEFEADKIN